MHRLGQRRRVRVMTAAAVMAGVIAGGCGRGHTDSAGVSASAPGCRAPVQEALDPHSTQHLFPGAAEPAYLTDPPTSGPHRLGPPPTGVVAAPISRPVQVAMLELGYVIIQYRPAPSGVPAALAGLAGLLVTVAPGPAVPPLPAPIVATAWTWKLACGSADPAALQAFIAAHRGKGFSDSSVPSTSVAASSVAGSSAPSRDVQR